MHIFLICPNFATRGGYEAQLTALATGLRAEGHDVSLFVRETVDAAHPYWRRLQAAAVRTTYPARWLARLLDPPARWRRLGLTLLLWSSFPLLALVSTVDAIWRRRSWRRSWQGTIGFWRGRLAQAVLFDGLTWWLWRGLDQVRRTQPPDLVDVQHSMIPAGITYAHEQQLPVVYTEYGAPDPALKGVWDHLAGVIHLVDHIIGRAEASYAGLARMHGVDRPHTLIPNAVTEIPATPPPTPPPPIVITAIGRLAPEKAPLTLLAAGRILLDAGLPIRLVFAGAGPLGATLETQTATWGMDDQVTLTGRFDQLAPIISATHIVAHASHNDGRSVAILEAMAWGRPVVAANTGGARELITPGVNGLLVPPGDAAALAQALRLLVENELTRAAMGTAGRRAFEVGEYTQAAMVAQTLAVYRQVLQRHNREPAHAH